MFPDGLYFLFEGTILTLKILTVLFHDLYLFFEELLGTIFHVVEGFNLQQIGGRWLIATFLGDMWLMLLWRGCMKLLNLSVPSEWGWLWFCWAYVGECKFVVSFGFVLDESPKVWFNIFFRLVAMSLGRSQQDHFLCCVALSSEH